MDGLSPVSVLVRWAPNSAIIQSVTNTNKIKEVIFVKQCMTVGKTSISFFSLLPNSNYFVFKTRPNARNSPFRVECMPDLLELRSY